MVSFLCYPLIINNDRAFLPSSQAGQTASSRLKKSVDFETIPGVSFERPPFFGHELRHRKSLDPLFNLVYCANAGRGSTKWKRAVVEQPIARRF